MRVLVACEFSGVVRDAFLAAGHDAYSCDIIPSERPSVRHRQIDAIVMAREFGPWDLMIAHPPCTFLCNSGSKHLYIGKRKENPRDPKRWAQMEHAALFFRDLLAAPIKRIAIENPVMHGHGQRIVGKKQTQTIQPWQFGHGEIKRTCLWLKNLPKLQPTNVVEGRNPRVHYESPGPNRWKNRSRTYQGIADAMASQWGSVTDNMTLEHQSDWFLGGSIYDR